jgi:hypothetical protein
LKTIVVKYGLISGVILAAFTAVLVPSCMAGAIDFEHSEILGYSAMVVAFLLVFFGIRSYREKAGGTITFGKAFQVGILITLVVCAVYVVSWQIVYYGFIPDFEETFAAYSVNKLRESGAPPSEVAAMEKQMTEYARLYKNPLFNIGFTFMEVFPVGLIVTLVSAAILRRRTPPEPEPASVTA